MQMDGHSSPGSLPRLPQPQQSSCRAVWQILGFGLCGKSLPASTQRVSAALQGKQPVSPPRALGRPSTETEGPASPTNTTTTLTK